MVRNTGTLIAIVGFGRALFAHLACIVVGNSHQFPANLRCCFFTTGGHEQDHIEKRPVVVAAVVIAAFAVVAANIVCDCPMGSGIVIKQAFPFVLRARRIEIAGGKRVMFRR